MFDMTSVCEGVLTIAVAVITGLVIPYVRSKTTSTQQAEIVAWVKIAVTAAEQIYTGTGMGKEKKAYVENWLKEHGVTVDESKLDALIESAVLEMNAALKNGGN